MTAALRPRIHYAWIVAAVTFVILLVAAAIRATPGVLIVPLEQAFGWSRATIASSASINLLLYGLIGPGPEAAAARSCWAPACSTAGSSRAAGSSWASSPRARRLGDYSAAFWTAGALCPAAAAFVFGVNAAGTAAERRPAPAVPLGAEV